MAHNHLGTPKPRSSHQTRTPDCSTQTHGRGQLAPCGPRLFCVQMDGMSGNRENTVWGCVGRAVRPALGEQGPAGGMSPPVGICEGGGTQPHSVRMLLPLLSPRPQRKQRSRVPRAVGSGPRPSSHTLQAAWQVCTCEQRPRPWLSPLRGRATLLRHEHCPRKDEPSIHTRPSARPCTHGKRLDRGQRHTPRPHLRTGFQQGPDGPNGQRPPAEASRTLTEARDPAGAHSSSGTLNLSVS